MLHFAGSSSRPLDPFGGMYKMNTIAKSNTGPPPAPINQNLQPLFRRTF